MKKPNIDKYDWQTVKQCAAAMVAAHESAYDLCGCFDIQYATDIVREHDPAMAADTVMVHCLYETSRLVAKRKINADRRKLGIIG